MSDTDLVITPNKKSRYIFIVALLNIKEKTVTVIYCFVFVVIIDFIFALQPFPSLSLLPSTVLLFAAVQSSDGTLPPFQEQLYAYQDGHYTNCLLNRDAVVIFWNLYPIANAGIWYH